MSGSTTLCEFCAGIPFDDPDLLGHIYGLGSGTRVASSQCPFCRLVARAYFKGNKDVSECSDVEVMWSTGPGKRFAFMVLSCIDMWIGFGRRDEDTETRLYCIEPTTGPVLDAARILRWISSCEKEHGSVCRLLTLPAFSDALRGLPFLRLIDLEAGCLVEKRDFEKYAALSYVWGSVPNFRLTKAYRTALLAHGSLKNVSHLLPNTIKDAITFVGRLGGRYLWVDALCLLQNDTEDLGRGVDVMDLIYERAWFTIVASCGHDANARLPGVKSGTRMASRNTVEIKPGVDMGIVAGLDGLLKNSVYDSRAWTFQEVVLSRRVIYFIDDKVFYRCRAAEHSEKFADTFLSFFRMGATHGSLLPEAITMKNAEFDYSTMLFYYTKRALTDQSDALRAMAGIIRRFTEAMKCRFLEGLPTALFDWFIIFHAFGNTLRRRPNFPSYSWAGWRGAIDVVVPSLVDADCNAWLRERTWIIWYKRNPSGITNLVWDPDANESFPFRDMTYQGYRDRRLFSDGTAALKQLNIRRTAPTEDVSFSRAVPAYPLLQFWTLSVFYTLTDIDVFAATGYLANVNNTKCGFVWLDSFEETTFFDSKGPFQVILLSEASTHRYSIELDSHSHGRYPKRADQWLYYNVLLLEWGGGIAERRGFGVIFQGAVGDSLAPGPLWTEIFLA